MSASTTPPLPRTGPNMRHGWLVRGELQRLAKARLESGAALDWSVWGYCIGCTLDAVEAGRNRIPTMPNGHAYGGNYFKTWAAATAFASLVAGGNAVAASLDEVPDGILAAVEKGCQRARARRHHRFLKGATIGRLLAVTDAERLAGDIRIIHAASATEKGSPVLDRKRERDRLRDAAKRRAAGAKPRSETIAAEARRMGISPKALQKKRQRERAKTTHVSNSSPVAEPQNVSNSSPLVDVSDVSNSSPLVETENGVGNHIVMSDETTHVSNSSLHIYEISSFVAQKSGDGSRSIHGLPASEPDRIADHDEAKPEPEGLASRGRDDAKAVAKPASVAVAEDDKPAKGDSKAHGNSSLEGQETEQAVTEPEWKPTRRQILPPPKLTLIGGLPVQVAHWVKLGYYCAEENLKRGRAASLDAELAWQADNLRRRMGRYWPQDVAAAAQAKIAARIATLADDSAPATAPRLADLARQYQPQP